MIKNIFASAKEDMVRATRCCLPAMLLGLAAILTLGCDESTGPAAPTGAIEITVSTAGANVDIDPNGYTVSIQLARSEVGVNATVTIGRLATGKHFVWLWGLASNCSVNGPNPLLVDVISDKAPSPVSFSVSCVEKTDTGGEWDY